MKRIINLILFALFANLSMASIAWAFESSITAKEIDKLIIKVDVKNAVRVATIANVTLFGTQTIDGVPLIDGDRILVKDQTDQTQNGIYTITPEAWIRSDDFDKATEIYNSTVAVTEGTVNIYSQWTCKADRVVLGESKIIFTKLIGIDPSDPTAE